jgi:membrane fusion protein, copper/silver efflux system
MKSIFKNRILQLCLVLALGLTIGWLIFRTEDKTEKHHIEDQGEAHIYTCSMHPQIRQNEPGKCPLCGMELIVVSQKTGNDKSSPFVYTMTPEAVALADVQTQKVKTISPEHEIILSGKIAVNEQRIAVITANYSGRIEKLYIDFTGQTVRKGQKLASIYSPELVTAQKELIEASKIKEQYPTLYNASKEKLRLWKITEKQISEIESRGIVLAEFDVHAERSGIVSRREISNGDFVSRGMVLFEIADLSTVWVILDAYESDLPLLKVGQKISVALAAVPGREFTTAISFIDPFIHPQTRTASVRAELSNPQLLFKPEMFVNGKIKARLSISQRSLVIPKSSVLWTGKRSVVYIKVPDTEIPAFEMREVTLGASLGDFYIVGDGLEEGEEIVTNGVFAIDAAAQLRGNFSMMNRSAEKIIDIPDSFKIQFGDFIQQYYELKNSLVKSNVQATRKNAEKLESLLKKLEQIASGNPPIPAWKEYQQKLNKSIRQLATAADIDKQRESFSQVSDQIIESVEAFGLPAETAYIAYCPMAFDNKGAKWLSEFKAIKNPYFGDAMLECGEVTKRISGHRNNTQQPKEWGGHQH